MSEKRPKKATIRARVGLHRMLFSPRCLLQRQRQDKQGYMSLLGARDSSSSAMHHFFFRECFPEMPKEAWILVQEKKSKATNPFRHTFRKMCAKGAQIAERKKRHAGVGERDSGSFDADRLGQGCQLAFFLSLHSFIL